MDTKQDSGNKPGSPDVTDTAKITSCMEEIEKLTVKYGLSITAYCETTSTWGVNTFIVDQMNLKSYLFSRPMAICNISRSMQAVLDKIFTMQDLENMTTANDKGNPC